MKHTVDTIQNLSVHEQHNVAATLQDLLEVCLDGETFYTHAAEDVHDPGLRSLLSSWAAQRKEYAATLAGLLRNMGVEPDPPHSLRARLQLKWLDMRAAIDSGAPTTIIAECERAEHTALSHYEHALKLSMPTETESILLDQAAEIRRAREGLDKMRHPW